MKLHPQPHQSGFSTDEAFFRSVFDPDGCLFPTVSSPSDYDTAPDVMEPVNTAVLRSEILVLRRISVNFDAHTLLHCVRFAALNCQI